ncbi:TPA: hypothetical protein U1V46_000167 [Streptococcus suis]|nr:hypothetical protein [Streptococcus suis]HEM3980779.1 hypothetical protein [Streptococcus suis]
MKKIHEIQKSIDTDFSSILNQYDAFLECSKEPSFVINGQAVREKVEDIIDEIRNKNVSRIPYDSITIRVIDFNANSEERGEEGLSESFDLLLNETDNALKYIIDYFINHQTFKGSKIGEDNQNILEQAIIAFYKLLEHTKLAHSQYQSLYQKTENELDDLEKNLSNSVHDLSQFKSSFITDKEDITKELEKIKETKSSIYTDFIAILGVFSAFIFVMFGGIEIMRAIFDISEDLVELKLSKIITISSLVLAGVLILMYSFLLWLARITGKDLGNCHKCQDKCQKKLCHVFYRHSFFLGILFLLILIAGLCYRKNF